MIITFYKHLDLMLGYYPIHNQRHANMQRIIHKSHIGEFGKIARTELHHIS